MELPDIFKEIVTERPTAGSLPDFFFGGGIMLRGAKLSSCITLFGKEIGVFKFDSQVPT